MTRVLRRLLLPAVLFLLWAPAAYAWSWPVQGPVLQPFSYDEADPYAGGQHRGVDLGADAVGEPVLAPASGAVSFAGTVPSSGTCVTIETPDGYSVTLTHLGSALVAKGAAVAEGDVVGTVGPSGTPEVDGPYVHLGIRLTADENGYLDPLGILPSLAPATDGAPDESAVPPDAGDGALAPAPTVPDPAASDPPATDPSAGSTTTGAEDAGGGSQPDPQPTAPPGSQDFASLPDRTGTAAEDGPVTDDGSDGAGDAATAPLPVAGDVGVAAVTGGDPVVVADPAGLGERTVTAAGGEAAAVPATEPVAPADAPVAVVDAQGQIPPPTFDPSPRPAPPPAGWAAPPWRPPVLRMPALPVPPAHAPGSSLPVPGGGAGSEAVPSVSVPAVSAATRAPLDAAPGSPGGPPAPQARPALAQGGPVPHARRTQPRPEPSRLAPLQVALAVGPGVVATAAALATALSRLRRRLVEPPVVGGAIIHLPRLVARRAPDRARKAA